VHLGEIQRLGGGGHHRTPLPIELRDVLGINAALTRAGDASANGARPSGDWTRQR
jgi:hypothetical protein